MPGNVKHLVDEETDIDGNCERGIFKSHKSLSLHMYIEGLLELEQEHPLQ